MDGYHVGDVIKRIFPVMDRLVDKLIHPLVVAFELGKLPAGLCKLLQQLIFEPSIFFVHFYTVVPTRAFK